MEKSGIDATVAYDARQRNQVTGFNLRGYGSYAVEGGTLADFQAACANDGFLFEDGEGDLSVESSVAALKVNGAVLQLF